MKSIGEMVPVHGTTIVFDVAASTGGAAVVLQNFYDEITEIAPDNATIYLVHSMDHLPPTASVLPLRFSWPKKNWLFRLLFDLVVAPYLVRKTGATTVMSLQNLMVPFVAKKRKLLLVHTSLPFSNVKFQLKDEPKLWTYQNILAPAIIQSIKSSDEIIVQTRWMKEAVVRQTNISRDKIHVAPVTAPKGAIEFSQDRESSRTFFFPASAERYKNHALVLQAVESLTERGYRDFRVIFTLRGDESKMVASLRQQATRSHLPITFIGQLSRDETMNTMARSILLFPSYLETVGLPLLEARQVGAPILAADMPFSREVLSAYERAHFFDPFDWTSLEANMATMLDGDSCRS